jgi:hypothetical protein
MPLSATFKGIEKHKGTFYLRIGKVEREFESLAAIRRWARSARDDQETVDKMLVDLMLADATDLDAINANIGKRLTLDVTATEKVKVQ